MYKKVHYKIQIKMSPQFILEKREDNFKEAIRAKVIRMEVGQMKVKFQKPRGEGVTCRILLKMCFTFLVSCFLLNSYTCVPPGSNLVIVYYFPCILKI